jgi:hypothetical protein
MPDTFELRTRLFGWCAVALTHADQLTVSYEDWRSARFETVMYAQWIEQGRQPETSLYVRTHHRRLTWGHVWRMNADIQAFLNSAAQVSKTVHSLGDSNFPDAPAGTPIRHARNFEEHWENPFALTVDAVNPNSGGIQFEPGVIVETSHEIWVGGAPLRALETWIVSVQYAVAELLKAEGFITPSSPRQHLYRAPRRTARHRPLPDEQNASAT